MKFKNDKFEIEITKEEIAHLLDKLEMFWLRVPDQERKQILIRTTVRLADSIDAWLSLRYKELKEKEMTQ